MNLIAINEPSQKKNKGRKEKKCVMDGLMVINKIICLRIVINSQRLFLFKKVSCFKIQKNNK